MREHSQIPSDTVADLQETVLIFTHRYKGDTTTCPEVLDGQRSPYGNDESPGKNGGLSGSIGYGCELTSSNRCSLNSAVIFATPSGAASTVPRSFPSA